MSKVQSTTTRYMTVKAFDYLTAGREYDVTLRSNARRTADFRRADGSGIGCYVPLWQFKRALADGSLVAAL